MRSRLSCATFLVLLAMAGCGEATRPPHREHVILEGDAYQRGLRHGQQLRSRIRSFHTTLLTNTLLPYLNREQADIAAFLPEYQKPEYQEGRFSRQVLMDSAKELERSISKAHRDELRGIADGSGLSYDDVLMLNTFVDTVLSVRGIAVALRQSDAPRLERVEVIGTLATDDVDNDEDGEVDEPDEGLIAPWSPSPFAQLREVPRDATFRFIVSDPDGVDAASIRLVAGGRTFTAGSELNIEPLEGNTQVAITFTPPAELLTGDRLAMLLQAGDLEIVDTPAPAHAHFMRDERLTVALAESGLARAEVSNSDAADVETQPTSFAFAVRGASTKGGQPLLGHNFALLDANTAHKHTATFEHRTADGKTFAYVGWAGVIWGFSGLNAEGVAVACNHSDSLDNAVVDRFLEQIGDLDNAKLVSRGRPIGFALRRALETTSTAEAAVTELSTTQHPFGWNCLVADKSGTLRAVEVDADVSGDGGAFTFGPGEHGASLGADDLRATTHYRVNVEDIFTLDVAGNRVTPQRFWSSYYFRSLETDARLQAKLGPALPLDVAGAQRLLAEPSLVDLRDSMTSVLLEPATGRIHTAIGEVPTSAATFETITLGEGTP